ncbi:MAG TPA: hypothetical protein VL947_09390, partial [Cytophagales bacterium]|nr:hypothetical protein [Cytophagales bacterium]
MNQHLTKAEIAKATADQITKDFGMHGVTLLFTDCQPYAYSDLVEKTCSIIRELLISDPSKLVSILYQVDLTEKDIHKASEGPSHYSYAEILAQQIIFRDLK